MSSLPPIILRYEGDGAFLAPALPIQRLCDKLLVVGELYRFERSEERSSETHRHYFAVINEAFANLPDNLVREFPHPDALRKWALIKSGWCDEDKIVLDTETDALAVAAYARRRDGYAVVRVSGNVVTTYTARSQNGKSQNRKQFGETKERVFAILAELIGTDPVTLAKAEAA